MREPHAGLHQRVVLTSSFAAVGDGHPPRDTPFDETSWTETQGAPLSAYVKSKTLAERAAWDFMTREGGSLELSVINPVGIFGPPLGRDLAASLQLVQRMMNGAMPAAPRLYFNVVDVRDVADLHLRAMTHPAARGERFLAAAGDCLSMRDVAQVLKNRMGPSARRVRTAQLPDWLVRLAAPFVPALRQALPELGKRKPLSTDKARRLLGWTSRSNEEALVATAESLLRLGWSFSHGASALL